MTERAQRTKTVSASGGGMPCPASRSGRRPRITRGFTLIEVLVALAVLAIALGALTMAASSAARNFAHLNDRTIAHWAAMNLAAEARLARNWPGLGASSGEVQQAGRAWRWEMRVSTTVDPELRRIDIQVFPDVQGAAPAGSLITFRGPGFQ